MLSGRPDLDPARLFSSIHFADRKAVVAALSGGGDSTALVLLLKSFLDRRHPHVRLVAITIDHGLRPESSKEAADVARFCAARGIEHRTLRWDGNKPATGLSAAGREARYGLLADAAQDAATDIVFIGHTADDQAETVLMRTARSEGRGAAAMAPATLHRGVWFVRPLLDVSREALRHFLRDEAAPWIEDPSNENVASERVRARGSIAKSGEHERTRLSAQARDAADKRERDGHRAAVLIDRHARRVAPGLVRLAPEFTQDGEAAVYALRVLLATIGGREHLPELDRTVELLRSLQPGFRATLSRAVIDQRKAGIYLRREARGLPEPRQVRAGEVWDGRFRIETRGDGLTVGPVGAARAKRHELAQSDMPDSLVRAALAGQPVPLEGHPGQGLAVRAGTEARDELFTPLVSPWARFLPSFDLAPARAVASLIGAQSFPAPPFVSHIAAQA